MAALIAGMALVTYALRAIPFWLPLAGRSPRARRFFDLLPFAILGALIVPGVFQATEPPAAGVAGAAVAAGLAWRGRPLIVVVLGAVAVTAAVSASF
ncbi:MAG: AzlD domain-containing protein [Hydrogenibacillus schlegelii]|nr:AzlD domain-containing protein [Hydrogenibacillus schlegelii]